jgi:hypothetical protein
MALAGAPAAWGREDGRRGRLSVDDVELTLSETANRKNDMMP